MAWTDWNELVDKANIFETTKKGSRPAGIVRPTHIVVHITGSTNFDSIKNTYLTDQRSAHYVVKQDGTLAQFVRDSDAAWHAGIEASSIAIYNRGAGVWQHYLRYLPDMKYPHDAVYVDDNLHPVAGPAAASYVAQADGTPWPKYGFFITRWGAGAQPVNFAHSTAPNAYSIGIENMSMGSAMPSAAVYPDAMYQKLHTLIGNLCAKYAIPRDRNHIVGHEDVNPIKRWGWDPNQGFDWARVI